jgi:methionyl-tRNA formyltransferase
LSSSLNIIFAGTPDFAAQHLVALLNTEHKVVAVYCPPDKPAGRGKKLTPCATKQIALAHNIPVEQPPNLKNEADQQKLSGYNADIMVVVAYGVLLPEFVLTSPRLGCINVHGSLLPEWRGAAPIQRSLEKGDKKTGVTIMQMDKGLDTGDMILTTECEIDDTDTSANLYQKLAKLGPTTLIKALTLMAQPSYKPSEYNTPQNNELATYAHKLIKEEAELNWQLSAYQLNRKIRAYIPWPVAHFTFTESDIKQHKIRVLKASTIPYSGNAALGTIIDCSKQGITVVTGQEALQIEIMQLPGKKALAVRDILNGRSAWFSVGSHINKLS